MDFRKSLCPVILALVLTLTACSGCVASSSASSSATTEVDTSGVPSTFVSSVVETGTASSNQDTEIPAQDIGGTSATFTLADLPAYTGDAYVAINGNVPFFTTEEIKTAATSYEFYSDLDSLGRCGVTCASVGQDIMPTEERGAIGQVKPTGWHTVKYDFVDGKYLYNRCHLIGYQLTGENANERNLITGTRYLNIEGMLPFENLVADYVSETGNHVLYRVTPYYDGDDLVAKGVLMEGYSVEDDGAGVLYNEFCYNVQPGVTIDYATGDSAESGETPTVAGNSGTDSTTPAAPGTAASTETIGKENAASGESSNSEVTYILNTNTLKFHSPTCTSAAKISAQNREETNQSRETLIADGYSPCGVCKP